MRFDVFLHREREAGSVREARYFGGGSPPKVPAPEPQPTRTDPDIQKREAEARLRARNRKGRRATILGGEQAPDVVQQSEKDLLGA